MNGISWRMGFFMMLIGGKIKIMNEDEFNKMRENNKMREQIFYSN